MIGVITEVGHCVLIQPLLRLREEELTVQQLSILWYKWRNLSIAPEQPEVEADAVIQVVGAV